jgi:hypothetical protein
MLAQDLIRLGAATDVVLADDAKGALERNADFYIKPDVLRSVRFTADGISDNWLGCGALFLTTWIGGLLVNDYRYDSNLQLSYEMFKPANASELRIDRGETRTSGLIDLAFLDRNDFFSWPTAQSLVLFPFWTSDDEEGTRAALTAAAVRATAEDLATYLQRDMEKSWPVAILESSDQRNSDRRKRGGLRVVEGRQIELFVAAREPIERCEATLRAGNEAKATTVTIVSKQPQQQRSEITASQPGFEFGTRVRIDVPELGDGPVDLRLTITARSTVTRTLRLFRDAASYDAYAKDPKRLELGSPAAASASQ